MKKHLVFTPFFIGLGLWFAVSGTASAQTALSAEARMFLSEWRAFQQARQQKGLAASDLDSAFAELQRQYGLKTVPDAQAKSETPVLPVWVTFRSAEAVEQALKEAEALGFKVQTRLTTICTGLIPVAQLEALGAVPGVRQVQTGRRGHLNLDESRKATRVDRLQDEGVLAVPDVPSFRGEGVIIGVVDGGMEYIHPNFYDPDNAALLRVQRVWAQREQGTPPEGYDYGVEYADKAAIEKAGYSKDNETHGTHTTGIAAGSGAGTGYRGIASKADVVMVPSTLVTEDILDGVNYIRNYALAEGKPCVVNLSIGVHGGPHDGTSAFDRALDEMKAPGFVVVGAAGNEGDEALYLGYGFQPSVDTVFYTRMDFGSSRMSYIDLWSHDSLPVAVEVLFLRNADGQVVDQTGFYSTTADTASAWTLIMESGGATVRMAPEKDGFNGKYHMLMQVDARNLARSISVYIAVKTEQIGKPTRIHMWANSAQFASFEHPTLRPAVGGRTDHTVDEIGGTSNSILSVGAFNTKNAWTALAGNSLHYENLLPLDTLSYFSSRGPRADGHMKPDVAAPGAMIVSSLNSHYQGKPANEQVTTAYKDGRDYPFGVMMGTSMAAPIVAGIVALCLQVRPDWQIDSLLHYISLTAINDRYTGNVRQNPDQGWGYGKIDALALLAAALGREVDLPVEEIREAVAGKRMMVYPNPNEGRFNVLLPEAGRAVRLQVVDRRGRVVCERDVRGAGSPVEMAVPGLKSGMYILRTDDGQTAKFVMR